MKRTIAAVLTGIAACAALVAPSSPANAVAATIYDATVTGAPNVPSLGFQATSTSEFGTEIDITGTTRLNTVQVQMSSWGCESKSGSNCVTLTPGASVGVPITLNIYKKSVDGLPGDKLQAITQTFPVPYRPGANLAKCPGGQWYDKKTKGCYNGKAFNITFKVKPFKVITSDDVVITVAYNTTSYGASPKGTAEPCFSTPQGCIYDSLNVGTGTTIVNGSRPNPGTAFLNSSWSGAYCDSTPTVGILNLDSPTSDCWAGYEPAFKVTSY